MSKLRYKKGSQNLATLTAIYYGSLRSLAIFRLHYDEKFTKEKNKREERVSAMVKILSRQSWPSIKTFSENFCQMIKKNMKPQHIHDALVIKLLFVDLSQNFYFFLTVFRD